MLRSLLLFSLLSLGVAGCSGLSALDDPEAIATKADSVEDVRRWKIQIERFGSEVGAKWDPIGSGKPDLYLTFNGEKVTAVYEDSWTAVLEDPWNNITTGLRLPLEGTLSTDEVRNVRFQIQVRDWDPQLGKHEIDKDDVIMTYQDGDPPPPVVEDGADFERLLTHGSLWMRLMEVQE